MSSLGAPATVDLDEPDSLADRPQRKRGKAPKETTDYLKAWLHEHTENPYPTEEEMQQLCNAIGSSMSQVSNWMINARGRLLLPAESSHDSQSLPGPWNAATTNYSGADLYETSSSETPSALLSISNSVTVPASSAWGSRSPRPFRASKGASDSIWNDARLMRVWEEYRVRQGL
ncbi:homeodomain superfamily [Stygiomarasmius scandens]|uniref:Homeodomain superfamily n=1 Tax=Marasmiellus scandens TaxID=2682957 RepID=A0ABR1IQ75_9AGAR